MFSFSKIKDLPFALGKYLSVDSLLFWLIAISFPKILFFLRSKKRFLSSYWLKFLSTMIASFVLRTFSSKYKTNSLISILFDCKSCIKDLFLEEIFFELRSYKIFEVLKK